jgi:hypothetical protein
VYVDDDAVPQFAVVVRLNFDLMDILHPSMVHRNPGGTLDVSRLPDVIRSSLGLTERTAASDRPFFDGSNFYYRLLAATGNSTMQQIFDAIGGVEGWNMPTFNMRLDTAVLSGNETVLHTMQMAEGQNLECILNVDWPALSTPVVAQPATALGETTHVGDVVPPHIDATVGIVAAVNDVGTSDVPPVEYSAALLYDPDTNEWSYAQ